MERKKNVRKEFVSETADNTDGKKIHFSERQRETLHMVSGKEIKWDSLMKHKILFGKKKWNFLFRK